MTKEEREVLNASMEVYELEQLCSSPEASPTHLALLHIARERLDKAKLAVKEKK